MLSPSQKPTSASSLIALLLVVSGISAQTLLDSRLQCLGADIQQTACGDKGSIAYCLGQLQPPSAAAAWDAIAKDVATCFVNAGCTAAEADIETDRTMSQCANDRADLRKRQPAAAAAAATPAPAITAMTPNQATLAPRQGLAHTGHPPVCFTTSLQSTTICPIQSTGSLAGHALPCYPTTVPTSVCADGLFCETDDDGNASCMYIYQKWDAAAIIIASFFAAAVTAAVVLVVTICLRDKRAVKKYEAAQIAREARLMADKSREAGTRGGIPAGEESRGLMGGNDGYAGGYGGEQDAGPFGDQHRVR